MRTATALAPDVFGAAETDFSTIATQEMRDREPRYLFYAGDEPGLPTPGGLQVASPCIPRQTFWRCAVTPALSAPVRMRAVEIPEGRMIDGTQNAKGLASMLLPCGPEVDELLAQYGHSDQGQWQKRWGLVELTALRGMQPKEVAALNLTAFFFPTWPELPETNKEVLAQLRERVDEVKKLAPNAKGADLLKITPADFPEGSEERVLLAVGQQMVAAVEMAQEYQMRVVRDGNMRVTFGETNDRHKPGFDSKDELFAQRSGVGLAINSLRGNQSDAAAAGMGAVLEKVLEKFQPQQQAAIDPQQIAAIVAATMQALSKGEVKPEPTAEAQTAPVVPKTPTVKPR